VKLIKAALAKYPWAVAPVYCLSIFGFFVVSGDVSADKFEAVIATQIPQELAEATKGLSSCLASAEPRKRQL
jgi:hypothetical protein